MHACTYADVLLTLDFHLKGLNGLVYVILHQKQPANPLKLSFCRVHTHPSLVMYVHAHTPHSFPNKHCWRDASLVRLNHLSVNLKSTSQCTFRPEESEFSQGEERGRLLFAILCCWLKEMPVTPKPPPPPPPSRPRFKAPTTLARCPERRKAAQNRELRAETFHCQIKVLFFSRGERDRQSGRKGDSQWARSGNLLPTRAPLLHALP